MIPTDTYSISRIFHIIIHYSLSFILLHFGTIIL